MPLAFLVHSPDTLPLLASMLVASLWQGVALVLLTACTLRLLPGFGAARRSALWTGVLLLAAILPLAPLLRSGPRAPAHQAIWHARSALSTFLIATWLLAAVIRLAQLGASALHLRRVLHRAEPLSLPLAVTSVLTARGRSLRVCASPDVDRPSVAGFLSPCILLPPDLPSSVTQAELRHILLHECEHLRRHDQWVNLLGELSLVVFPLSPALIWVNHRLALERELACDDRVIASTGARKAYAACLARVAETSLAHRGLALALGILGARRRSPEIAQRVKRILAPPVRTLGRLQGRMAAGALCTGILGGAALLAHSPELVSFVPSIGAPAAANAQWNAGSTFVQPNTAIGRVVPVVYRVSGRARALHATMVKAVVPHTAPARTSHKFGSSTPFPRAAAFGRPEALLTNWHSREATKVRTRPTKYNADAASGALKVVPVLLRVYSSGPVDETAWYPALRFPDGWVVVMI